MSELSQSLSHSRWHCKYQVVFVPKRRRKTLFGAIRRQRGPSFHALARHKECHIIEGQVMPEHVPIGSEVPPQHAVASVMGFLTGKSALASARQCGGHERHVSGEHLWARGYAVSTVGFELEQVTAYIRDQNTSDDDGRFEAV